MDGFFRILKKAVSELISTRLYYYILFHYWIHLQWQWLKSRARFKKHYFPAKRCQIRDSWERFWLQPKFIFLLHFSMLWCTVWDSISLHTAADGDVSLNGILSVKVPLESPVFPWQFSILHFSYYLDYYSSGGFTTTQ